MDRISVLRALARMRSGLPIIISPGLANYPVGAEGDDPLTIYNMDMPYATPMALGVALGWPDRKVIAIEGDGSMLAGPGVFGTIARYRPSNLVILVFENGSYLTTGSGRAPTSTEWGTDIEALGRAAGLSRTTTVHELDAAVSALQQALRDPGPWLLVAKVDKSDREAATSNVLPVEVFESGLRFRRACLEQRPHSP